MQIDYSLKYHPNILNAALPYPRDWWKKFPVLEQNTYVHVHVPLLFQVFLKLPINYKNTIPLVCAVSDLGVPNALIASQQSTPGVKGCEDFFIYSWITPKSLGGTYLNLGIRWMFLSSGIIKLFEDEGFDINEALYPSWYEDLKHDLSS